MSRSVSTELLARRATLFDFRVWFLHVMSFLVSAGIIGSAFAATVALTGGGELVSSSSFVHAMLLSGATSIAWVFSLLGAMIVGAKDRFRRASWAWVLASALGIGLGMLTLGATQTWLAAIVAVLMSVLLLVPLRRWDRWTEGMRMTGVGVPSGMLDAAKSLPKPIPARVRNILDIALNDWQDLRDLLSHRQALGRAARIVDVDTLVADADKALNYMLERAAVVSKLEQLASGSPELAAKEAADLAISRLSKAGQTLHEAVRAASKLAASEDQDEAYVLKARVDGLQEFAAGLKAADEEVEAAFVSLESEFDQLEGESQRKEQRLGPK